MKTQKLLYWFAAIVLLGLIEYATATTNISSPEAPFQYAISILDRIGHKVAELQR